MKRILFFYLILLVFLSSCAQKSLTSYTVEIPDSAINNYLKKEFPVTQKLKIGKLIIKDPKANIDDKSNKLKLGSTLVLKIPFVPEQTGKIYVAGNIAFDQQKKELYLINPTIENLSFNNQNISKYLPSNTKSMLAQVVEEVFKQTPIYKINDRSISGKFIKDIKIQNGKLLLTFGL